MEGRWDDRGSEVGKARWRSRQIWMTSLTNPFVTACECFYIVSKHMASRSYSVRQFDWTQWSPDLPATFISGEE